MLAVTDVVIALITFIAILFLIVVAFVIWTAYREIRYNALNRQQAESSVGSVAAMNNAMRALDAIIERLKQVEYLSRDQALQLSRELKDLETGLKDYIKVIHGSQGGMNVNFHGGASGTQIGDGNKQI